jgi:hypothetical protein
MSGLSAFTPGQHVETYDSVVSRLKVACPWVKRWRTFQGGKEDHLPASKGKTPCLTLSPTLEDNGWQDTATFRGRLVVAVEITIETADYRDLAKAWRAIKTAFYPADRTEREAVRTDIAAAAGGIATGYVVFGGLQYAPVSDPNFLTARGRIAVDVNETLDP